ncbi:MAG TPA: type I methionyl aminopeptidase [Candidatus Babeliales bacterium]|jgi:methionyl aminopeptidase|nr:type I methionyl aminopeptidase [Candidatus Babeliales bacterium]
MIHIKNKLSIQKMAQAGFLLSDILVSVEQLIKPGISTAEIDAWIESQLHAKGLVSSVKGYMGYRHVSCISVNDTVVHGVPRADCVLQQGDLVKVDVCASWNGYCADMARSFFVGQPSSANAQKLVDVAHQALKKGIDQAQVGNKLSDISAAIQEEVEKHGFSVVRDFAGHGIGKNMHEAPEIVNYGKPGRGPILREGMTFAIEPMITAGKYHVYVADDGWTVKTVDHSLAAHVEDTIAITNAGPIILTGKNSEQQSNVSVS